jgi:Cell morphogenesis C-terminal/Cell morphogenesis central region
MFLVDLMVAPVALPTESAIKLVHAVLILWDHYTVSVQEQAREMLVHLIHELVTSKIEDSALAANKTKIERLVESIRRSEASVIWTYEDNNGKEDDDGGSRVPGSMVNLSREVVELFSMAYNNFNDIWAKEALSWASTCPVRHLACRSFQVFRCVSVTLDLRMLADMLARLSNTIADEQTDYQTFSMEILTTLKVIINDLDSQDVLRYAQLFWTTCACLNTIHEREFSESLGMLEKLLDRLDMGDPTVVRTLSDAQPTKWEGDFDGLQPLVYKGLKSVDSLDRTLSILDRLADLPNNELVGDSSRLLYSTLANLPRFLRQFDLENKEQETLKCALRLAEASDQQGVFPIAQCLTGFANGRYRNSSDFIRLAIAAVRSSFFPEYDGNCLVFLMGFLTNRTSWFRLKTMEILCVLIPEVDMKKPDVACHGPDLISPLLRLLQTDLCPQALEVMDHIMEVSGNPMERHHIRMSLASGSARAIRKEYERTQSLYGIPLTTGWSIPMPAVYSSLTRNNVHAVFYTCGDSETMQRNAATTPEVEFRADEGYSESYFPTRRTNTMKSVDTAPDANMNDLLLKLDSLDDFFDEPNTTIEPTNTMSHDSADSHDSGTNIYDQQTAPILKKSLARTASSSSFQNALAESRPTTSHQKSVMKPTAFNTSPMSGTLDYTTLPLPAIPTTNLAVRPTLHGRSITSPANNFPSSQPNSAPAIPDFSNGGGSFLSVEDESYDEATFSDSESSPFPHFSTQASSTSFGPGPSVSGSLPAATTRSAAPHSATEVNGPFSFEGMRRGMRRLTGTRGEREKEKDRIREMARMRAVSGGASGLNGPPSGSPRVPRVPLEYLSGNSGAAMSPATSPGV